MLEGTGLADVEVAADGGLVIADGAGHRLLRRSTTGTTTTVVELGEAPTDLALDGSGGDLLVAGTGLQRLSAGGSLSTLMTGGSVAAVAPAAAGIHVQVGGPGGTLYVLRADRSLAPVLADREAVSQAQGLGQGVLLAGGGVVRLVTDPGLALEPEPLAVTATPGPGRVLLDWDGATVAQAIVRAKKGSAPVDQWDGEPVDDPHTVLRVGGPTALVAGEEWYFSVFFVQAVPWHDPWAPYSFSAPVVVRAAALVDDVPPPGPVAPSTWRTRTDAGVRWNDPWGDDFLRSEARFLPGTTPPMTPEEGEPLTDAHTVPGAVAGTDYAISIFTIDLHGNVTRWSGVTSPDATAPGPVTDVRVTPTFRTATVELTLPDDPDLVGYTYGFAAGDAVPERQPYSPSRAGSFLVGPLTMDTTYTLAVWTEDDLGNRGEPVVTRFRTPLDTVPPGAATGLTATGGDYRLTASWTPPADTDLESVRVTLVDLTTGAETAGPTSRTSTTHTWTRLPGGRDYEVRVTATDVNGLVGPTVTATGRTADDANGPPPPIDPATVVVTPRSATKVSIAFPKPVLPDLKSLGYALIPVGADPDSVTSAKPLTVPGTSTVTADLTLPEPLVPVQLVLYVFDLNSHRARSVVPSIVGAVSQADLPFAPTAVRATAGASNSLSVTWGLNAFSPDVTEWVVTATSGTERRTVTVPAATLSRGFTDLPGRRDWIVSVAGRGTYGTGPASSSSGVTVADVLPPAPATGLVLTPSYDTQLLSWTNPTTFDFTQVVVTRYGATAGETKELYRGTGTSVRATGLVGGRSYTYVVATYDAFGQTSVEPARATAQQSTVGLTAPSSVRYPDAVSLRGNAVWQGGALSGRGLVVQAQKVGSTTWSQVATVTTSSNGNYAVSLKPAVSTRYRVGYAGSGARTGTWSSVRTVSVAPSVSIRATRTTVPKGASVTVSTVVGPKHASSVVTLQRWTGRSWVSVTTRKLSSSSAASAVVRPSASTSYRWVLPAHADHATGTSATLRLTVR
ncbi:hypothetical protein G7075_12540 [Phycicoccus sp. HDW14]|uniref:fibronectin type III domain-containing protein n=1 Tax=Phycicoccus sp. HDW14 TaxID=2714941 RepID=UPI00140D57E6|nr:fibronectin type III domain-containing protein [Phycicoccus sp. HDW14]QIM21760.1 hypothetical protein G7075_12540 [Phycicoccus sp. HDW14]